MKPLVATVVLFCGLIVHNTMLQAQGVYVSPGEKGPVFSDKPQSGAKEVILKPINIVPPPEAREAAPATGSAKGSGSIPEPASFAYRSFSVTSPENDGSVMANSALFEVRVAVDPPLQLGERHAFVVSINGRPVGQRFTATEFMIPPEFWGDTMPPANQSVQLDASIIDGNGQVLKRAAPVQFFMRYTTILNNPRRHVPPPMVHPKPTPSQPRPDPGSAVGATIGPPVGATIGPAVGATMKRMDN